MNIDNEPDGNIWLPHHFWIGLIVMLGGWIWWGSDPTGSHVTIIGLLIVADDLIEHYVGIPTPLDYCFKYAMRNYPRFREYYTKLFLK
jgi:hypothetical protein